MQLSVNGVKTQAIVEGEGPAVTLIHGVASSLESWDKIAERLSDGHRVIRYDLRGHGRTDTPPGPYAISDFADDLLALLDELNVEKTHVVGFSLGGLIVQSFALNHPEQTDKAVIISAVANKSEQALARLKDRADEIDRCGVSSVMDAALERWFTPEFRQAHPELVEQRVKRYLQTDPVGFAAAYRTFMEGDLGAHLHRIRVPTLVMTGEHDPGSSVAMARFIHEQIRGSELHILPRLRHNVLLEAPSAIADRIGVFLG